MDDSSIAFLQAIAELPITHAERAVALLWQCTLKDPSARMSASAIANELERAGYGRQNSKRLSDALTRDARATRQRDGTFRIRVTACAGLEQKYGQHITCRPVPKSDAILPADIFVETRTYLEKVVDQINASYRASLFDCCAVMCRRLLETLIIEVYEAKGIEEALKQGEGHFMMFGGLLGVLEGEKRFTLGRNSVAALRDFKRLGDLSAHNRRFNARQHDIDKVAPSIRVAAEELLHLAGMI